MLPQPEFAGLLLQANRAVERLMLERLEAAGVHGVRMGHLTLLRVLPHDGGARVSDLAAAAGVTRQAITQVAADLATLGLVTMRVDPSDRRGRLVAYTARGRRGHLQALQAFASIEDDLLASLGPRRLAAAKAGLTAALRLALDTGEEGSIHG